MKAITLVLGCVLVLSGCKSASPVHDALERHGAESGDDKVLAEFSLRSLPVETNDDSLFEAQTPTVIESIQRLQAIEKRENVKGLFLRLGSFGGGWGRANDVSAELLRIKAQRHLPVHCHFDTIDNAAYAFAARVCDRITMTPAGDLGLVGVAGQVFHLKQLLDSVGIGADFMHVGRFKSAAEPLTRDSMSEETRESLTALLGDVNAALTSSVAAGRRLDEAATRSAIDDGPHDSESALAHRLVDHVAYDDEARRLAKEAAGATRVERMSWGEAPEKVTLSRLLEAFSGETEEDDHDAAHVAVAILSDEISDGESEGDGAGAAGPFVRELRRLADDPLVKSVVLRINSPGGSALASDRMWHAVRRVAARKPVLVSVGDMAASGGYYIAAGAQEVHASPASIVGSIGVVGGKLQLQGLFERAGIHAETIPFGRNAGWQSPTAPFSASEREVLQRMMQHTYDRFVDRIHIGREMDEAKILAAAEGRVWSGTRGLELELVDSVDVAFADVIRRARERGGVGADVPLEVWPRERNFIERIAETMNSEESAATHASEFVLRALHHGFPDLARLLRGARAWFASEPVRLEMPFAIELK
jgi:protease-4